MDGKMRLGGHERCPSSADVNSIPGVEASTFVDTKVVKSVGWRLFYSPNVYLLNHFD